MNLILLDTNPYLYKYWSVHYSQLLSILKIYGLSPLNDLKLHFKNCSIESLVISKPEQNLGNKSTAIVTPTNSLSYMGGGFDKYLLQSLLLPSTISYKQIEPLIQHYSLNKFNGYLPVNLTNIIELLTVFGDVHDYEQSHAYKNWNITTVIQVPSMIVPEAVGSKTNIFDSIFNVMLATAQQPIGNLIIPGIGTGYGQLDPEEIAKIMIFSIVLFNLNLGTDRFSHLKKSCLILFFFNKDYRKLSNELDLFELHEKVISEYGKTRVTQCGDELMEFEELFKCIRLE